MSSRRLLSRRHTGGFSDGIDLLPLLEGEDTELQHDTLVWDMGPETAVGAASGN